MTASGALLAHRVSPVWVVAGLVASCLVLSCALTALVPSGPARSGALRLVVGLWATGWTGIAVWAGASWARARLHHFAAGRNRPVRERFTSRPGAVPAPGQHPTRLRVASLKETGR